VGENDRYASIIASYSNSTVTGNDDVGGFVGYNDGNITTSYSTSTVRGDWHVGGLVGENDRYANITASYSNGTVNGNDDVGGFVGHNDGNITTSYSTGSVTGDKSVGGLVGCNHSSEAGNGSIATSYSTGTVTGNEYLGGLVGVNRGSIATSYSTGTVSGEIKVGGLVGYNGYDGKITSSFWDMEASGLLISYGGEGKTTAKMRTASTFLEAGWDFVDEIENGTEDIWSICEGADYPKLTWQFIPGDFNEDYNVDLFDLAILSGRWSLDDSSFFWCRGADLTGDGFVDFNDLEVLADNWLAGIAP
jgi:hypothetical protein